MHRFTLRVLFFLSIAAIHLTVLADDWAQSLRTGSLFPSIEALDQSGQAWNNQGLSGAKGFLFMFSRSVVW